MPQVIHALSSPGMLRESGAGRQGRAGRQAHGTSTSSCPQAETFIMQIETGRHAEKWRGQE